jgi:hypothetical protein
MSKHNHPSRRRRLRLLCAATALGGASSLIGLSPALADSVDAFAKRLSTLRGEVESLSSQLSALTTDSRDELRSLARQKADLELELKKEETRVGKLGAAVAQKRRAIEADQGRDAQLEPLFLENLDRVRGYVAASLPFRREERLAELKKLETQLETGLLSPPRALSRLWTFVEDEFRLTRENGLYQQTITVDGQEQLADVVRIGSVMLFFKTRDDEVGHVVTTDGGYEYRLVSEPAAKKQILSLFDSFRKQIRAGYFDLPNAIATSPMAVATPASEPPASQPSTSAPAEKAGETAGEAETTGGAR